MYGQRANTNTTHPSLPFGSPCVYCEILASIPLPSASLSLISVSLSPLSLPPSSVSRSLSPASPASPSSLFLSLAHLASLISLSLALISFSLLPLPPLSLSPLHGNTHTQPHRLLANTHIITY